MRAIAGTLGGGWERQGKKDESKETVEMAATATVTIDQAIEDLFGKSSG